MLKIINNFQKVHKRFKTISNHQEVSIPVPWGHVGGKWWGPTDSRPILTLHGWQDNCGSFNRLIPLLNQNIGFLAIDFPGHGFSSRIPSGMYSHFTNYVILIQYLVNYFKWNKVSLMGHSMGGVTSFVYTMLYPENVDFLVCIDGAKPMVAKDNVPRIAKNIQSFLRYARHEQELSQGKEPPSYTLEEITKKICQPNKNSINPSQAQHIFERNIAPSKVHLGKYYFTRDPRLKVGELLNFPQEESVANAHRITCPIFLAKAKQASYYEVKENFYQVLDILKKHSKDCIYQRFEGTHHLHLNNPDELAQSIRGFIDKYGDVANRAGKGGLRGEITVKNHG